MKRRTFIKTASLAGAATMITKNALSESSAGFLSKVDTGAKGPIILSTWDFGMEVPQSALKALESGGTVVDAVEKAVMVPEADPKVTSVGYGGFPDRDGKVTLDACITDGDCNCGSVLFLEHIMHPISVARLVMEKTPHVILAGEGALQFALENGFKKENLLTPEAEKAWKEWLKANNYNPPKVDKNNHDTIGLLAMDAKGNMAGACTTSGMAWKIRGRVGDSPIIGAGLYVDGDVGGATSTGIGEAVIKVAGSFLIVELMRNGKSPQDACRIALERIVHKQPKYAQGKDFLAGFVAMNKAGEIGAASYRKGLQYTLHKDGVTKVYDAEYMSK
ncbi:MAG: N(4)-(beta-N-acetylglucosaminyl)-L-asparaginase [Ignavibacteriales bacterium]|nr:N(4)-(beta-N-acetylglucosaminyl)-L-asparaginase [Ignavibacteriales bacterium]